MTSTPPPKGSTMLTKLQARMRRRRLTGKATRAVVNPLTLKAYPVTYPWGIKSSRYAAGRHTGADYACPTGSLALALGWGEVIHAGPASSWGEAYGNQVIIRTGDGAHDYAHNHLSAVLVKVGDHVTPGQVVGLTGATGNVTGPHDHLEARPAGGHYGSDINPATLTRRPRKAHA